MKRRSNFGILTFLLILSLGVTAHALPERRNPPSHGEFGYLLYPIVAKVPGLGWGYGAGVLVNNMFNTDTRLMFFGASGAINAYGLNFVNIDLVPEHIHFDLSLYDSTVPQRVYDRGMLSSAAAYNTEMKREYGGALGLNFSVWQKRIVLSSRFGSTKVATPKVIHHDGVDFIPKDQDTFQHTYTRNGLRLDITDDWNDPREGLRLEANRSDYHIFDPSRSLFHIWNYSASAYVPVLENSTWVFNYFRSASYVTQRANRTQADLQNDINLDCGALSADPTKQAQCQEAEARRIRNRLVENEYGSSTFQGGAERLRSFPTRRFQGSQTIFYGTEFRWNMKDEDESMDLGFIKGKRSNFQLAAFYEAGAVSDPPMDIYSAQLKVTYGAAFRMIFSGAVVRAEYATGEEGSEVILFYGYPWGMPFL